MILFGKRQAAPAATASDLATLRDELARTQADLRALQGEFTLLHDQCYKWMKRAVAAERAERNQEPRVSASPEATPATRPLFGARARIAERRGRFAAARAEGSNGVH